MLICSFHCCCCTRHTAHTATVALVKGDKKDLFDNLEYEDKRGAPPRIYLLNDDGTVAEEFNAETWDTDAVVEFLSERLVGTCTHTHTHTHTRMHTHTRKSNPIMVIMYAVHCLLLNGLLTRADRDMMPRPIGQVKVLTKPLHKMREDGNVAAETLTD